MQGTTVGSDRTREGFWQESEQTTKDTGIPDWLHNLALRGWDRGPASPDDDLLRDIPSNRTQ